MKSTALLQHIGIALLLTCLAALNAVLLSQFFSGLLSAKLNLSFIILLFFFLGSFLVIPIIFIGERVLKNKESNNAIETFQYNFFRKIRDPFRRSVDAPRRLSSAALIC